MKLPVSLDADLAALRQAMDQSLEAWAQQHRVVARKARRRTARVLSAAVEQIAPMLNDVGGVYLQNAGLASTLVDLGGSPLPLQEVMPTLTAKTLEYRAGFPALWQSGGRQLPTSQDQLSMALLVDRRDGLGQARSEPSAYRQGTLAPLGPLPNVANRQDRKPRPRPACHSLLPAVSWRCATPAAWAEAARTQRAETDSDDGRHSRLISP